MDLLCERCGEPWGLDYVQHEMDEVERLRFHTNQGCPSCYGKVPCDRVKPCSTCPDRDPDSLGDFCGAKKFKPRATEAQDIQAALRTILGDDLDGLAAEMEDLGLT